MDSYDVVIIGTGAGGGTLAAAPRPLGQADPAARARRLAPARAAELVRAGRVRREPLRLPDTWYDEKGKPFQPQIHYFVGGATKLYGAALYRLRKEDFGELRHHDGISPAWPISYDELEPYYTLGRAALRGARRARRGSDRAAGERAVPVPGGLARAADPAALGRPRRRRLPPVPRAVRDQARRGEHALQHCIRCATCDGFPCLVHAKSDAEVLGVRPALEHPNVTLLTNARVVKLETNESGTRSPRSSSSSTARPSASRRTSSSSPAAPPTPRSCCSRRPTTSTRTGSRTAPTRSAATTCSTTAWPCSRSRARRTRPCSRRRSG